jgi:hypothetical protein
MVRVHCSLCLSLRGLHLGFLEWEGEGHLSLIPVRRGRLPPGLLGWVSSCSPFSGGVHLLVCFFLVLLLVSGPLATSSIGVGDCSEGDSGILLSVGVRGAGASTGLVSGGLDLYFHWWVFHAENCFV